MEGRYDSCNYKARRDVLGIEFEVRLFDVDAAGVAVVAFQSPAASSETSSDASPLKFSRVFSRNELRASGIMKTLEGFVTLVDSLELVEDAYFTAQDAMDADGNSSSEFAAIQLSSSLPHEATRLLGILSRISFCIQNRAEALDLSRVSSIISHQDQSCSSPHHVSTSSSKQQEQVASHGGRSAVVRGAGACLKDEVYDELKVSHWVDVICDTIMRGLSELRKPLKYIVSCLIMQKNGAGVHASVSCHWDTVTDGAHVVKWPSDKHKDHNRSMYCIITVGGLSFT